MNAYKAFRVTRHGFGVDPTGAQVVWNGRLGDVTGPIYDAERGLFRLALRTFNREHAANVPLSACDVLERTF